MKMKIGTYNIQHGRNFQLYLQTKQDGFGVDGIDAILRTYGVEICALNEVFRNTEDDEVGDQAGRIAAAMGYYHVFAKAADFPKGEYGVALISKFPIVETRTVPISLPLDQRDRVGAYYEDRVLLIAEIDVDGKSLTAMVSHFGCVEEERALAIQTVKREIAKIKNPILLMGDFNLTPDSAEYDDLITAIPSLSDTAALMGDKLQPNTFRSDRPTIKIDYIFVDASMRVHGVTVPETMRTDHRPYFCEVEW